MGRGFDKAGRLICRSRGSLSPGEGGGFDFEVAETQLFKDAEFFLKGELALLFTPFGFGHCGSR